jgi:hypothetical protein
MIVFAVVRLLHRAELLRPLPDSVHVPDARFDGVLVTKSLVVFGGALVCWLAGLSLPLVAI